MYRRFVHGTGLLVLMLAMPALARAADKPGVVLRFASLDQLRADVRYLSEVVGQKQQADDLEKMLDSPIGQKALKAIDGKKPLGAYGTIGRMGIDSTLVALVPVADQEAFVGLVGELDAKPEKGDDGVYTVNLDKVPAPVYFRFANGYAYVTARDKDALDKDKLLDPAAVLPAERVGAFSLTVNIDQIPDNLKDLALGNLENQLANVKEQEVPNESGIEKRFRLSAIDELGAAIKSVFTHGGETTLRMDLDRKTADLSFSLSIAGKAGTPLAATIKDLGQIKSITASLIGGNSAMHGLLNVSLPENLRGQLGPVIEEGEKKLLAKADKAKRDSLSALLQALRPTFKNGQLDVAGDLRGPNDDGLYTVVFGIKVKDGAALEKTFRRLAGELPEAERKSITFDVEKVGSIPIGKIVPDKKDDEYKRFFGENPVYFAVREDVILWALGDKGMNVIKEALASQPRTSKVAEFQMSMRRLAPLLVKDNKSAPEVARKVFAGEAKDSDKLRFSLEGGQTLKLHLGMKTQVLAFFNDLQKAKAGR